MIGRLGIDQEILQNVQLLYPAIPPHAIYTMTTAIF